jgi:L-ascorbate metabolism protein UlaG (beta-lactamase superfamily)
MHIRYIGHAGLAVEVAGQRLLCDPWWNGPAYTGQWHHYPPPRPEPADLDRADFVYISHGHEDHLHVPTLRLVSRAATLLIPRLRSSGMRDFLQAMGFHRVIEMGHGERRRLAPGLHATVWINKEDSILALEGDGRTLLDANDALHACSRHVIDHLCEQIRARHPRIDTLLLGYGSASWFPNCIQISDAPAYDAEARERVLLDNFVHAVRRLQPRMALPFAASFVLLEERLRWINDMRFSLGSPCDELRRHGLHDVQTHFLMPGDRILDGQLVPAGGVRPTPEQARAEIGRLFAHEIAAQNRRQEPDEERLEALRKALLANADTRRQRVLRPGQRLTCRIDVRDVPSASFLVDCEAGAARVERCPRLRMAPLVLSARLEVLEAWASQDYGFESLSIGYGATLQLRQRDLALRQTLLSLLGRKPLLPTRGERLAAWLRDPLRSLGVWRDELHWQRLALRLRRGEVQRVNDIYSSDPARWLPEPERHPEPRRA